MSSNNFFWNFFRYIKIAKDSSVKYYQNNKKRLPKKKKNRKACERYQDLFKKKRKKSVWYIKYISVWYRNLPEDEKQKLVEYKKDYKMRKETLYYNRKE